MSRTGPDEPGLEAPEAARDERCRRDRLQEARLTALHSWLAGPHPPPAPPEKLTCLACHGVYARGEPGSTWRFCAACRQGASRGNDHDGATAHPCRAVLRG